MSLGQILILIEIHVFCSLDACPHLKHDQEHIGFLISGLLTSGLIEYDPRCHPDKSDPIGYVTTAKGRTHIDALHYLPLPECTWRTPDVPTP